MAETILMKNPTTGEIKKGFIGYSWTMLLFQYFAPLFRRDFSTANPLCFLFVAQAYLFTQTSILNGIPPFLAFACITCPCFVWSFFWNKWYTVKLLAQGFIFADSQGKNRWAEIELGKKNTGIAKALACYTGVLLTGVLFYSGMIN